MAFYADLHIHSKYSRATSRDADLEHMAVWGAKKGIQVLGTGDFTHPAWRAELASGVTTKLLGFRGYLAIFVTLLLGRLISICNLAWVDRGSLETPVEFNVVLAVALALPSFYAGYCVHRYFGPGD